MFLSYHSRSFTRKNNWLNRISFVYSWMSCFCFIPQLLKDSISPSTLCSLLFALLFSFFIPLFCLPASRKGHYEGYRWTTRWRRGNGRSPEGVRGVKELLSPQPAVAPHLAPHCARMSSPTYRFLAFSDFDTLSSTSEELSIVPGPITLASPSWFSHQ